MVNLLCLLLAGAGVLESSQAASSAPEIHSSGPGELEVLLVEASGEVLNDAEFNLIRLNDGRLAAWLTASEHKKDRFVFSNLSPGRYSLEATNESEGFHATAYADVV